MRLALLAFLLATPLAALAQAQEFPFNCKSILANAERCHQDMQMAAGT